jgi:hypothetical protein
LFAAFDRCKLYENVADEKLGRHVVAIASARKKSYPSKVVKFGDEWSIYQGPFLRAELRYLSYLAVVADSFTAARERIIGPGFVGFEYEIVCGGEQLVRDFLPIGPVDLARAVGAVGVALPVSFEFPPMIELPICPLVDDRIIFTMKASQDESRRGVDMTSEVARFCPVPHEIVKKFEDGEMASRRVSKSKVSLGDVLGRLCDSRPGWFSSDTPPDGPEAEAMYKMFDHYRCGHHYRYVADSFLRPLLVERTLTIDDLQEAMTEIERQLGP